MLPIRSYRAWSTNSALAYWATCFIAIIGSVTQSTTINAQTLTRSADNEAISGVGSILRAVGRIECSSGGMRLLSTATLVEDRRTLISVSHFNFYDETGRTIPVKDCEFELLNSDGNVRFRSGFDVVKRGSEGRSLRISRATDWAILRLLINAPDDSPPLPVDWTSYVPGDELVKIVGYDARHRHMKTQFTERNCEPEPKSTGSIILIHKCPTSPGASGAPLIANVDGRAHIVAIHVAHSLEGGVAIRIAGYAARSIANRAHLLVVRDGSDANKNRGTDL